MLMVFRIAVRVLVTKHSLSDRECNKQWNVWYTRIRTDISAHPRNHNSWAIYALTKFNLLLLRFQFSCALDPRLCDPTRKGVHHTEQSREFWIKKDIFRLQNNEHVKGNWIKIYIFLKVREYFLFFFYLHIRYIIYFNRMSYDHNQHQIDQCAIITIIQEGMAYVRLSS